MHLSCTDINIVSKWTKTRFHTTHVTYEFQRVHPKLFMTLLYVQCKLCTYLALRLALSPNGPNRAPPDPRHLGVPPGASKTILWAYVWCKPSTYLAPILTLSQKRSKRDSTRPHHLGLPSDAFNTIFEPTIRLTQTKLQSCIKVALSTNGLNRASTWASSPRNPTECV
jgi:hypothetical protein